MSSPDPMPSIEISSDAGLVTASLAGDRRAFSQIVERYQRLLCSLAYSATGQLSQSEDLAQETFIEAWRSLGDLREPEKLRAWLCGILRFKVSRLRRSDGKEPVRRAAALDEVEEIPSSDQPAVELAIHKEEQAILWSALERVPELYREPLILYYREHRSIEHVAAALDLTDDAVKQRLARGRKILQEKVLAFVEGALARSTPGRIFTLMVVAALPEIARPAKAIGFGTAVAKGGMIAKSTGLAALLASSSGVIGAVLTLRANLDQARTARERRAVVKLTLGAFFGAMAFLAAVYGLRATAFYWPEQRVVLAIAAQVLVFAALGAWPWFLLRGMRAQRVLRSKERLEHPELFLHPVDRVASPSAEYKSSWKLFNVPLIHVRFSTPDEGEPPVIAWVAGGDRAIGLLAAWGGCTVAPFSVGAISIGLVSVGSLSVGVISIGTVGFGLLAIGCAAVGVKAYAWLSALGWQTAQGGGFSIAGWAAEGPLAFAPHANDLAARQFLANPHQAEHEVIFLATITLLSLVPIICYADGVRRRLGREARSRD